jgi:hypothetical protein
MSNIERQNQERLDRLRKTSETLQRLSDRFTALVRIAERDPDGPFPPFVEAAGQLTLQSLDQLRTLLEITWDGILREQKAEAPPPARVAISPEAVFRTTFS